MSQIEIRPFFNQGLFSNNYLDHHLPQTSIWTQNTDSIEKAKEDISIAYQGIEGLKLGPGEEASLEEKLIRPVLKILGYELDIQPTTQRGAKKKRPDYALFRDKASLEEAHKDKNNLTRFFSHPLTILEAKYWGRRLNDADTKDKLDARDPTAQTVKYLDDVYHASEGRIQWAILTNGKVWRLFYYRASSRSGNFYDIDLESIIQSGSLDAFKYFYLFFSRDAFLTDPATGKTWLDQHLKGSEEYAARVSAELKDLIFDKVFEGLATGFIEYRRNELGIKNETEEGLKEVFKGCLTLLYRLLFLLYAESRGLLPVDDQNRYYKKSLKKLKENIVKDISSTGVEGMSRNAYDYWSSLESLCRIIDKGDKALNVPIYNGGLFETLPESFLSENKISDPYLAEAIQLLTIEKAASHEGPRFIDYSSLGVRHLGDIYEGLLEFHVRIADEDIVEVKEKNKFFWKRSAEVKEAKSNRIKKKGDVYIENSKHERKATGSYYTPHYIVEYIVKNTVGPVLDERFKRAEEMLSELDGLYGKQRKQLKKPDDWKHWEHPGEPKGELIDEILKKENDVFESVFDIKTLDPSMGSGHFLVHAVDYISDRIITFLTDYPENPVIRRIEEIRSEILKDVAKQGVKIDEDRLTEVNLIKRTVMKRCIYGVDLNQMAVELAKLSLWLDSFTLGAPLSFLDHHLKWGNSLIGTNLEALEDVTKGQLFTINLEPLKRAIRDMLFVSSVSDATYQQVKDSAKKYNEADTSVEGYRILLDILVSEYFGTKDAKRFLLEQGTRLDLNNLQKSISSMSAKDRKVIDAIEKVAHEKRFFHWEIEFPEVFYERNGGMEQKVEKKKNPGFDCVIGNPPYYTLTLGKGQEQADQQEMAFFEAMYPHSSEYKMNTFALFSERALKFIRCKGFWSFILPNTVLTNYYLTNLRKWIVTNFHLQQFLDLRYRVFDEAEIGGNALVFAEVPPLDCAELTTSFSVINNTEEFSLKSKSLTVLSQSTFARLPDSKFLTDPKVVELLMHIQDRSQKLGDLATFYQGIITGDNKKFLAKEKVTLKHKKILRGEDINRYGISFGENYVLYEPSELWSNTEPTMFLVPSKIVSRQTSDHLVAALDTEQFFTLDSTHVIHSKVDHRFLLALFNSKLLNFVYQQIVPEVGKTFAQVKLVNLKQLPIPRISFKTPEKKRKKKVAEGIALYKDYMSEFGYELKGSFEEAMSSENSGAVEDDLDAEGTVSKFYSVPGEKVYGIHARDGQQEDAGRVSEDTAQYTLPIDFKRARSDKR
ncbi:MAG: TaqI-like C-terminal specificity domain-containing protein [Deltaproteobacteria bacterium]|nr:TaqI-like C-terminal specificity domain-containing protein [Deltaproteobacteria bacterium]